MKKAINIQLRLSLPINTTPGRIPQLKTTITHRETCRSAKRARGGTTDTVSTHLALISSKTEQSTFGIHNRSPHALGVSDVRPFVCQRNAQLIAGQIGRRDDVCAHIPGTIRNQRQTCFSLGRSACWYRTLRDRDAVVVARASVCRASRR